jgi:probable F420-dependent oxidoreductase
VKFGAWMYQAGGSMDMLEFARVAEHCGFDYVGQGEHSHRPVTAAERHLKVPEALHPHATMFDEWVLLGAWAAMTSAVKLGTAITLIMERDPIWLAKEIATLDVLSGGRAVIGIGGGHMYEPYLTEMRNHGTAPNRRWAIMRERTLAVRTILANDEAEFHGRYVDFDPIWAFPKPIQQPHPPFLLGSSGYAREYASLRRTGGASDPDIEARSRRVWEATLGRLLDYCDGWMPPAGEPDLGAKVAELQHRAKEAGKPRFEVSVFGPGLGGRVLDEAAVEGFQADGVDRIILSLPAAPADVIVAELKRVGALATRYA